MKTTKKCSLTSGSTQSYGEDRNINNVIIMQCATCCDKGKHERLREHAVSAPNPGRVKEGWDEEAFCS